MEAKTLSVLEHAHITEMQQDLQRKLQESQKTETTGMGALRRSILGLIVGENYDQAKDAMHVYVEDKHQYPAFQSRVERYVQHCVELIHAIQTKRNFPGLATLSLSKQQEIHEKVLEHFEELKQNLKHIEKIERDHKLTDVRSTVWVMQSLSVTVFVIVLSAFLTDLRMGLFSSLVYMVNHYVDLASTWVVNLIL